MQLLDLYRSRFGTAVKQQGNGWNGPCPLCGGQPGKSDRFMVWPEREESLGQCCADNGIKGIWSCRKCGASGDTIAYLMKVDGLDFKAALGELGIEGGRKAYHRKRAPVEPRTSYAWQPKSWQMPSDSWSAYAAKLVEEAEVAIWQQDTALRWLAARGIDEQAVRAYRIGYLPAESAKYPGRWRHRKALGLDPRTSEDGKVRDKIFIPRGIVVPTIALDGRVLNLRIRRHREDLRERSPKYLELEGSCKGPLLLKSSSPEQLAAYFVTEAELDAMLIHHASGGVVGALAVRTNRGKPDEFSHRLLRSAVRVCVALDYDDAGAEGVEFWEKTYPSALRWPTPEGKDPGDAFQLGVDIREWVAAALPPSISMPVEDTDPSRGSLSQESIELQHCSENGHLDPLMSGQLGLGGRGKTEDLEDKDHKEKSDSMRASSVSASYWASEDDFTTDESCRLQAALPKGVSLTDVPLEVCRGYLLWRRMPVIFIKTVDADGNLTGFRWERDYAWCREHQNEYAAFMDFQEKSRVFSLWISEHPSIKVTAKNLFKMWGYGHEQPRADKRDT